MLGDAMNQVLKHRIFQGILDADPMEISADLAKSKAALSHERARYRALETRRSLDLEGFSNDIAALKRTLKPLEIRDQDGDGNVSWNGDCVEDCLGVAQLRDDVRSNKARYFEALQSSPGQRVDQPNLVGSLNRLWLVLESVTRTNLADPNRLWQP
jgi:hypothetical protein